jgi:hypothetical protein
MTQPPTTEDLAVLEALADPRTGVTLDAVPAEARDRLAALLDAEPDAAERAARARTVEWAGRVIRQDELLAGFARHCEEDLEDVTVEESTPTLLVARWRAEISRIELRAGTVAFERLAGEVPTMLVTDLGDDPRPIVARFLDDADLRGRIALFDPVRLEKVAAVRSSVFVYLEWHLRDAYGVKVLPSPAFTGGLVERGIISLGMG